MDQSNKTVTTKETPLSMSRQIDQRAYEVTLKIISHVKATVADATPGSEIDQRSCTRLVRDSIMWGFLEGEKNV